jgi:hypothetical protein
MIELTRLIKILICVILLIIMTVLTFSYPYLDLGHRQLVFGGCYILVLIIVLWDNP